MAFGGGAVWFVVRERRARPRRPQTPAEPTRIGFEAGLLTSPSAVLPEFSDIAFGLGSLWIVNRAANSVVEVDPATNQKLRDGDGRARRRGRSRSAADSLWVANFDDDTVSRIVVAGRGHPRRDDDFPVGDGPVDVAVGEDGVWVASSLDRTVTRLDPETGEVVATIEIGNEPQRMAAGGGAVWVSVRAPETGPSG